MSRRRCRARVAGLSLLLCLLLSACSDDTAPSTGPRVDQDAASLDSGADAQADTKDHTDTGADLDVRDNPDANNRSDAIDDADAGGDADTSDDADAVSASGFQLSGQLVPTGGLSLSNGFSVSGHLSPTMPEKTSTSASFSLKIKPVMGQTTP